jgi:hypothetical protein
MRVAVFLLSTINVVGISSRVLAQDAGVPSDGPAPPAPAGDAPATTAANAAKPSVAPSGGLASDTPEFLLTNQGRIRWGAGLSLLRLSFSRQDDEPGRIRNFTPKLERIAPEIGFQFAYSPPGSPWRLRGQNGIRSTNFQMMSIGGALLVRLSDQDVSRGGISLAAILGFFEDRVSLGIGFDVYRGIAIADAEHSRGGATAYTGLASWAFAREGELTPENVFIVVSVNLAMLGGEK